MGDRPGETEVLDLRVREHLVDRVDRAAGNPGLVQKLDPVQARLRRRDGRDRPVDVGAVLGAAALRAPLGPLLPRGLPEGIAEPLPHPGRGGGDGDRPVGGRKHAGRDRGRMVVAGLPRHLAGQQPARRLEIEHEDHRLEQARVHPAAFAGGLALEQRHHDRERQKVAGREIGDRDADPHRHGAGMAGDAHEAAHALGDLVDAGPMPVGTGLAEARDRGVDDPGIDAPHGLVVDAEAVLDPDPHVLDDDVGLLGQAEEDRAALLGLQVRGPARACCGAGSDSRSRPGCRCRCRHRSAARCG